MVKHKHKVTLEKTIFLDRFMLKNITISEKIQGQVGILRDNIKTLENSIKEFKKFGGSDYDIREMLNLVCEFL